MSKIQSLKRKQTVQRNLEQDCESYRLSFPEKSDLQLANG